MSHHPPWQRWSKLKVQSEISMSNFIRENSFWFNDLCKWVILFTAWQGELLIKQLHLNDISECRYIILIKCFCLEKVRTNIDGIEKQWGFFVSWAWVLQICSLRWSQGEHWGSRGKKLSFPWVPTTVRCYAWRWLAKICHGFKVHNLITCKSEVQVVVSLRSWGLFSPLEVSEFWPTGHNTHEIC